jgi:hypothetical protein
MNYIPIIPEDAISNFDLMVIPGSSPGQACERSSIAKTRCRVATSAFLLNQIAAI